MVHKELQNVLTEIYNIFAGLDLRTERPQKACLSGG